MKPIQNIKHLLSFSRGEQRGIVILATIILFINILRIYVPNKQRLDPVDFASFSLEIDDFLQATEHARNMINPDSARSPAATMERSFVIDLNRADTLDLQRLRGIGPSFARRITGYRARLGGFVSVDQILEVYGMDSVRFLGIKSNLKVDTLIINTLNLNSISFKDLIAHPYMPFELAKEIILYRKKHKLIETLDQLKGLKNYDTLKCNRLIPYIEL